MAKIATTAITFVSNAIAETARRHSFDFLSLGMGFAVSGIVVAAVFAMGEEITVFKLLALSAFLLVLLFLMFVASDVVAKMQPPMIAGIVPEKCGGRVTYRWATPEEEEARLKSRRG